MGINSITNKQIKLLKVLVERPAILAPWDDPDLCDLRRADLVATTSLYRRDGKLAASSCWAVTDFGRRFLDEERAGR